MTQEPSESPNLRPRDRLLRDTPTLAETMTFWLLLIVTLSACLINEPRSFWLLGGWIIGGILVPAVLKTHEQTHPFFVDKLWPTFWLCGIPVWAALGLLALGQWQPPLGQLLIEGQKQANLTPTTMWLPTAIPGGAVWVSTGGFAAAYLLALLIFIVPKSRAFFERLFAWLCLAAALTALIGYAQVGLSTERPFLTRGTGAGDFFARFPYDGHWAAFATLWCSTCMGMALLTARRPDGPAFFQSRGPWYLTGAILLGASGLLVDARLPAACLLAVLGLLLLRFAWHFFKRPGDPHRWILFALSGLGGGFSLTAALGQMTRGLVEPAAAPHLRQAARELFAERPLFGWGFESYPELLPIFGSDWLGGQRFTSAGADFWQLLAEFGLFGAALASLFFGVLLYRYFVSQHDIALTNHLLTGCGAILILTLRDNPFMSPSVFFSFFLIFFSALRWADLTRNKVDEVDAARPQLVTPERLRRVPFHTQDYEDKEL